MHQFCIHFGRRTVGSNLTKAKWAQQICNHEGNILSRVWQQRLFRTDRKPLCNQNFCMNPFHVFFLLVLYPIQLTLLLYCFIELLNNMFYYHWINVSGNIYTGNTVICLEYSIIMTTENIDICTVRKSRHNNHKAMYS